MDALKRSVDSNKNWLKSYVNQGNRQKVEGYISTIKDLLEKAGESLGNDSKYVEYSSQVEEFIKDTMDQLNEKIALEERKKWKGRIDSSKRWFESSLNRIDEKKCTEYIESVEKEINDEGLLIKAWPVGGGEMERDVKEIKDWIVDAKDRIRKKVLEKEIGSITGKIDQNKRWLESYLKQKNPKKCLEYREAMVKEMEVQREKLLSTDAGRSFLERTSIELEALTDEIGFVALSGEADKILREARSDLRWTTTHLGRKDTRQALVAWERCLSKSNELSPKYSHLPDSIKFLQSEFEPMNQKITQEISAIEADSEVESLSRSSDSQMRWFSSYEKQKNVHKLQEYIEDLQQSLTAFDKYPDNNVAQAKREQISKFIQEGRDKIGPMIAEQEIETLCNPLNSSLHWLKSAIQRKDVDKCVLLREQVVKQADPLQKYVNHNKALTMLKEVDSALESLESQVGAIVAEKNKDSLLNSARSSFKWLESALNSKDPRRAQVYGEELGKKLDEGLRGHSERFGDAKTFVHDADRLLERMSNELGQILVDIEVERIANRLGGPISFFKSSLESRDPEQISKRRETLIGMSLPLRPHVEHSKRASQCLGEIDALLKRCEDEMGVMIADKFVNEISSRAVSHMKWAEAAHSRKDSRGGLLQIQSLHQLVHPLRVEYPEHTAAQKLLGEADALAEKLGPTFGEIASSQDFSTDLAEAEKLLTQAELEIQSNPFRAASSLKSANTAAASLRKLHSFRKPVADFLQRLDKLNMDLLGCIPKAEKDSAPLFEVDWHWPVAVQDELKCINELHRTFNSHIVTAVEEFDSCVTLDGSRQPPGPYFLQQLQSHFSKASDALQRVAQVHLPKLTEIDPQNPAIQVCQDTGPALSEIPSSKLSSMQPQLRYCETMWNARGSWSPYRKYFDTLRSSQNDNNSGQPNAWSNCIDLLNETLSALKLCEGILEDNYPAEEMGLAVEGQMIEAEAKFKTSCVNWHKKEAVVNSNLHSAERYRSMLKDKFPDAEEIKEVEELHSRVEATLAEEARKAAEEAAKRREAERLERERLIQIMADKWKKPYEKGGDIIVGDGAESWQYNGNTGVLSFPKNSACSYTWVCSTSLMKLLHNSDNQNYGYVIFSEDQNGDFQFELKSECRENRWTWVGYSFKVSTGTFTPTSGKLPQFRFSKNGLQASGSPEEIAKFKHSIVKISGDVPPPVALFAAIARDFIDQKIPKWVEEEMNRPRRCNRWVGSQGVQAWLCNDCGWSSKKDDCLVCDRWMGSSTYKAQLCSDCGWSSRSDDCAKCGKWCGSTKIKGHLCSDCGWSTYCDNCCKMLTG